VNLKLTKVEHADRIKVAKLGWLQSGENRNEGNVTRVTVGRGACYEWRGFLAIFAKGQRGSGKSAAARRQAKAR